MKALIIEDEYPAAERLERLIRKEDESIEIVAVLESVKSALSWFESHAQPDLIFSDIQLSDGLSFQIFEQLPATSPIIFTTSYDEYAIKAFKVKSIDYLLKPIKPSELAQAIAKFKDLQVAFSRDRKEAQNYARRIESLLESLPTTGKKYKSRFLIEHSEQLIPVAIEQIAYFLTANEMVCLVQKDNKQFLINYTLEELEQYLDPALFFRLNRQFIAHLSAIRKIHTYFNGKLKIELHPDVSQDVLVSREKSPLFKLWIEGR